MENKVSDGYVINLLKSIQVSARNTPEKVLLSDSAHPQGLSAARIWDITGRIRSVLYDRGVGREDFVLIRLPRGVEPVLAMLGVWRAGAACVAVDDNAAPERVAYIRKDCGCKLDIDSEFWDGMLVAPPLEGAEPVDKHDAALAVYTSGTTGNPKGALHEYGQFDRGEDCFPVDKWFGQTEEMVIGYSSSLSFSAITMFFVMMSKGRIFHVVPLELPRDPLAYNLYLGKMGVTACFMPPSYFRAFGGIFTNLKHVLVAGEPANAVYSPDVTMVNVYGMSETTFLLAGYRITEKSDPTPVGKPAFDIKLSLLSDEGAEVPEGESGEICVENPYFRGYIGMPEETEKAKRGGLFHTGDLGKFDNEGNLVVIGRFNDMVKINGNRVEPAEVECVARRALGLDNVACRIIKRGDSYLICIYYIGECSADAMAVREEMKKYLPYYMIPAVFMRVEEFPKTSRGKLDRNALPTPDMRSDVTIVKPSTEFEKQVFPVVASELGTEDFGVMTNLLAFGLSSVRAIRLSIAIEQSTGYAVSASEMLSNPRICDWKPVVKLETSRISGIFKGGACPLTENQVGVYLDWAKAPNGLQYNDPFVLRFGHITGEELREAVFAVLSAHPALLAHLGEQDGSIVQIPCPEARPDVKIVHLDSEPEPAFFQSLVKPFDLLHDDLSRWSIFVTDEAAYLFFDIHHIVFDGGSMNILMKDLDSCLRGGKPSVEEASSFDFSVFSRNWLSSDDAESSRRYFDELVSDTESFLYPSSRSGAAASGKAETVKVTVLRHAVRERCRELGITENAFLATAFCEIFRRASRIPDIQIATVSNGRTAGSLANTMGMFVQTLPLVSKKTKGTVAEEMRRMQDQIAGTIRNDRYPFTRLVESHGLKPNVLYAYQGDVIEKGQLDFSTIPLATDTAKVPLCLNVTPGCDEYEFSFEYDAGLYEADEISILSHAAAGFVIKLADISSDTELASVQMLNEVETQDILKLGIAEKLGYDRKETFIDQFSRSVAQWPEVPAVRAENGTLTYKELDVQSDVLARKLISDGVKSEDFIAIRLPRVKEFLVAVLGVWKAGGAYLPLGSEYPEERIRFMIEDSGAKILIDEKYITEANIADSENETDDILSLSVAQVRPENLAYMIYTSGSTGKPKGTMLEHGNLRAFNEWLVKSGNIGFGDAIAVHSSFSFDGSCLDLYPALTVGGTVHILPKNVREDLGALDDYFRKNRIKGGFLTARLAGELLANFELSLEYLMAGGEKVLPFKPTEVRVMNGYGPTECTILSTCGLIDQTFPSDNIPLGRPVPNTYAVIVDMEGNLLPRGMAGELCLCGPQIARGYWKRPELTAEKFLKSPFYPGERMYRTGDLCKWNDRDELICLGRIDKQVKLRGFRIELGEIEATLAKIPFISNEAVEIREVNGIQHLVAYYVSDSEMDSETLKSELAKHLTSYMVPELYMRLESLPLTPNGKVDRKALPNPEIKSTAYVAPEGDIEVALAEAFGKVFGMTVPVSAFDSFTELGGDSIKAIRLISILRQQKISLMVSQILNLQVLRKIAEAASYEKNTPDFSQSAFEGDVEDTALLRYFNELNFPSPGHFSQYFVFKSAEKINSEILGSALRAVINHHDMLRAVLKDRHLYVREADCSDMFTLDEYSGVGIDDIASRIQGTINLSNGPLVKSAIIRQESGDYLLMIIHHLVVDGVSWRVISEDLNTAYRLVMDGKDVELPAKTASYDQYARSLVKYKSSSALVRQTDFWKEVCRRKMEHAMSWPKEKGFETGKKLLVLDRENTSLLLKSSPKAYNTEPDDLFLSAIGISYFKLTGEDVLTVQMESHGREPFDPDIEIDRTVGWFTAIFPVLLDRLSLDCGTVIRRTKQFRRHIPNKGFGYPQLMGIDTENLPLVTFNYLGEFKEVASDNFFSACPNHPMGAMIAPENKFGTDIAINAILDNGEIRFFIDYNVRRFSDVQMSKFSELVRSSLLEIIEHTAHIDVPQKTASDYGEMEWDEIEFEDIYNEYLFRKENIQSIHPLTKEQMAKVRYFAMNPDLSRYETFIFEISTDITREAFKKALVTIYEKHEYLRSTIAVYGTNLPRRIVSDKMPVVTYHDFSREENPYTGLKHVVNFLNNIAIDLQTESQVRIVAVKVTEFQTYLLICNGNILIDMPGFRRIVIDLLCGLKSELTGSGNIDEWIELLKMADLMDSHPDENGESGNSSVAGTGLRPSSELEINVAEIFSCLLDVDKKEVFQNSDFMEMGGDNFGLIELTNEINLRFNRNFSVSGLCKEPKVSSIAKLLENKSFNDTQEDIHIFSDHPEKPKLFFVHTANTGSEAYFNLAKRISDKCSFYVFEHYNLNHPDSRIEGGIPEIAAKYISIMRLYQPHGPYLLGGWCYGGTVAFEMANQLTAQGEKVEHIILLDSHIIDNDDMRRELYETFLKRNREYLSTADLFAGMRSKGLLETLIRNSHKVSRDWLYYNPPFYSGKVTYFKAMSRPQGITGVIGKMYDKILADKAAGYESCTESDKLSIYDINEEHDSMMSSKCLDVVVPRIESILDENLD